MYLTHWSPPKTQNLLCVHPLRVAWKDLQRKIDPIEAIGSHVLPTNGKSARLAGAPQMCFDGVSSHQISVAAGNCMNVPSVGAFVLACVLCLKLKS